jgi:uncharacterized protein YdeI (YjbR/CyaY-like superfamily)
MFTKTKRQPLADGTAHKLPPDMRRAILADKQMLKMWDDITPLARNEWICWTITVAKPETRVKHIKVMRDKMHQGERRPCCWMGCPHRTDKVMSSAQKWVLSRRSKSG